LREDLPVERSRRPSAQTIAVLRALAEQPTSWRYGYDLCTQLGLQPGSMYPILIRLADRGLLEADWETGRVAGRPPRHLYRLTGAGLAYAAAVLPDAKPIPRAARRSRPQLGST
jgi:DNA-binding PadR family transcriptional regulator